MCKRHAGNDFLSIKEFSNLVGMTIHALRLYDKRGIFRPAAQGVGFKNRYRYYSPTQITVVKMIRTLSEIGVPLNIIKEMAHSRTPETMLKLLSKNKDLVADEIRFLHEVYSVIGTFIESLNEGIRITETDITLAMIPEKNIILGGINDFNDSEGFFRKYTQFCCEPHVPKLNLSYPVGGYFESMSIFMNSPSEPTRFFSLDPKGYEQKAGGLYLIGYTRGYYGHTNDLPNRMWAYAKKNGLMFNGPVYNIYLFDELSTMNKDEYLLQVSASVIETRRVSRRRPQIHYSRK